jgi:hypothetical protein
MLIRSLFRKPGLLARIRAFLRPQFDDGQPLMPHVSASSLAMIASGRSEAPTEEDKKPLKGSLQDRIKNA